MKKIQISALALCLSLGAVHAATLDLGSKATLRQHRLELRQGENVAVDALAKKIRATRGVPATNSLCMMIVDDLSALSTLEAEGVTVLHTRGNIVLASMPTNDVERISALPCISKMELARPMVEKLKAARESAGVDKIHAGTDLPKAYTGKGVIAGLFDSGLDPNHINFKDSEGNSRISWLAHLFVNSTTGNLTQNFYGEPSVITGSTGPISAFTTDDSSTFHGTHTLGIMAGSYTGTATVAQKTGSATSENVEMANPYYGVATGAELAVSCGDSYDEIIAYGVDYIIGYAEYANKPCVINLSLGSNTGPHDSRSVMGQFLELAGEDAIICVSSGNEGDHTIAFNKTFTDNDTVVGTFIDPYYFAEDSEYYLTRYGQVYIYSNDDTPFEIQAITYNRTRQAIAFRTSSFGDLEGSGQYYVSSSSQQESDTDIISVQFGRYFNGYIGIASDVEEYTGRYYALIDYYTSNNAANTDDNYIIGFIVKGKSGQRIDAFCDGAFTELSNYGVEKINDGSSTVNIVNGSTNGTISDMACANNILVVGSYNSADDYPVLAGNVLGYQGEFTPGGVSDFSSYGTLADGRNLPHVLGPGAAVLSSCNKYFIDDTDNGYDERLLAAKVSETDRDNYWCVAVGTSMSSPFVAGAIATWLEADKTLTINDVKDIIAATAVKDEFTDAEPDQVKVGYGKFDAYAGLKEVLNRKSGLNNVMADESRLLINQTGNRTFNIFVAGESQLTATLLNLNGQAVAQTTVNGNELDFNVDGVENGIYLISVNGKYSQKVVLR
jgi:hypothetical protein